MHTYYNGNLNDSTNFESTQYLQINSCGIHKKKFDYTIYRNKGRKDYLILLVTNGECEVLFDNKTHLLHKGDLVIYKPHEKQRYFLKNGCEALWLHFNGYAAKEVLDSYEIDSGIYYFHNKENVIYDSFILCMDKFNHLWKKRYAISALLDLLEKISLTANPIAGNKATTETIESILSYISLNYNKNLTLHELAKKSGYSKSRFSHVFAELTGTTPIKYQNEIRIRNAYELLITTNMSIGDISFSCGFNDPMYFSRIFKKKYGKSPNQCKKESIQEF